MNKLKVKINMLKLWIHMQTEEQTIRLICENVNRLGINFRFALLIQEH